VPSRFLYEMTGQAENAAKARRAGTAAHAPPKKHSAAKGSKDRKSKTPRR
jgi:hypothetical protein